MSRNGLPPGPRHPRALQTLAWMTRPVPFLERARDRYGDTFTIHFGGEPPWVVLSHPDAIRQVFTGDPRLLHAGEANEVLRPLLGDNSVLLLDDEAHLVQRKLLLPPFHGERMQRLRSLIEEIAAAELDTWPVGRLFPVHRPMQTMTLELIVRAVFGVREADRLALLRERLRAVVDELGSPRVMSLVALLGPGRMRGYFGARLRAVDEMLFEEIAARRRAPDLGKREDIMSQLLQATHDDGTPMSDQEVRDELLTLLVAGHETTATALSWAVERLVRHPDALARLRDETLAGEDAYADAVAKETLRLRPVLPVVLRRLKAPMELAGDELPEGATVAPCIVLVHRREDVYPEPHRFRPERFLEQPAGTYTWIPFGGGVRRCIGGSFAIMEMKVLLGALATRLQLRAADPAPEPTTRRAITLAPKRGGVAVVTRRSARDVPAALS